MKKNYWINIFKDWFDIPATSNIIFYRNPNECSSFNYEKINPDHIGYIWGNRKKKLTKNKLCNPIKVCKIIIPSLMAFFNFNQVNLSISLIIYYMYLFFELTNINCLSCLLYVFFGVLFVYSVKYINIRRVESWMSVD